MDLLEWIIYLGVILGVLASFVLPWMKKNADLVAAGKTPVKFSVKYIYALVIEIFVILFTIGTLLLSYDFPTGDAGLFPAFMAAFIYGMITSAGVKMPFDWLESYKKTATT